MGTDDTKEERSYIAFISYRHFPLDREAALRVQKRIENYTVPKELRDKTGGKKLGLCFRDEDELPASSSLTDSIYYALDHTQFLIVICTPDLPLSKWCEAEIRYFLRTHDRDHILAVLADGDPSESFSPYMLHTFDEEGNITGDVEPLAANIAGPDHTIDGRAFKKESTRVIAALVGCPFDELWQRERRARAHRLLAGAGAALAVMAVFLGVVLNRNAQIEARNAQITAQNEQITTQNEQITAQNERITEQYDQIVEQKDRIEEQVEKITEQNTQITEQNVALETQLSSVRVDNGISKLKEHDIRGALTDGVDALQSEDPAIYDHRAVKLLTDALCAYQHSRIQSAVVYEQTQSIRSLRVTDDERFALICDLGGALRCLDLEGYEVRWEVNTGDGRTIVYTDGLGDRVLYKSKYGLYCLSAEDGSLLWSYVHQRYCSNYFQAISEDSRIFAVADRFGEESYGPDNPAYLVFLDTETGAELGRTGLSRAKVKNIELSSIIAKPEAFAASFAADGRSFACMLPAERQDPAEGEEENISAIFTVDLDTFEKTDVGLFGNRLDSLYGIDLSPEDGSVFLAGFSVSYGGVFTVLCTETDDGYEYEHQITDHDQRAPGGLAYFGQGPAFQDNDCHMLANDSRIILFDDDRMFLFDRAQNQLMRCLSLTGIVTNARWVDDDLTVWEIVTSDGCLIQYKSSADWVIENAWIHKDLDQTGIRSARSLNGGLLRNDPPGQILTVGGENDRQLLLAQFVSDPHGEARPFGDDSISHINGSFYLEDPGILLLLHSGYDAVTIDLKTGTLLKSAAFADSVSMDTAFPLDEETFLLGDRRFGMDGTVTRYGEPVAAGEDGTETYPGNHVRLKDGSVLSWNDVNAGSLIPVGFDSSGFVFPEGFSFAEHPDLMCLWIDGEPVETTADPETGLMLYYNYSIAVDDLSETVSGGNSQMLYNENGSLAEPYYIAAGGSGLWLGFGRRVLYSGRDLSLDDSRKLYFYDVFSGAFTEMENAFPGSGRFTAAIGNEDQVAAALYDDGTICIYDPAAQTADPLEHRYSAGEVSAMCYSKDDQYLVILTMTGQMDIYETEGYTLMFREMVDFYHDKYQEADWIFRDISAEACGDTGLLNICATYLGRNYCTFVDTEGWTIAAEVQDVYACDPDTGKLFCADGTEGCFVYPLYNAAALAEWAREVLE